MSSPDAKRKKQAKQSAARKEKKRKEALAKRRLDAEKTRIWRENAQKEADRVAAYRQVPQPAISPETLTALMEMGAAKVVQESNMSGTLEVSADLAWTIDPWVWTRGEDPIPDQKYLDNGTEPPVVIYVNRDYQVSIFDDPGPGGGWPEMWHLSYKRRDREPFNDWRIKQRIKNSIVGPEHEGVELNPAESRLVDTANQLHLYVIKDPEVRFPFGFQNRMVTDHEAPGTKQRPGSGATDEDEAKFREVRYVTSEETHGSKQRPHPEGGQ